MKNLEQEAITFEQIMYNLGDKKYNDIKEIIDNMKMDDYDTKNIMMYVDLIHNFGDVKELQEYKLKLWNIGESRWIEEQGDRVKEEMSEFRARYFG